MSPSLGATGYCASVDADHDHPQLFGRGSPDLLERLGALGVLERLGDDDHRVDEQGREHVEILGAPRVEPREAREVGGQLRGESRNSVRMA